MTTTFSTRRRSAWSRRFAAAAVAVTLGTAGVAVAAAPASAVVTGGTCDHMQGQFAANNDGVNVYFPRSSAGGDPNGTCFLALYAPYPYSASAVAGVQEAWNLCYKYPWEARISADGRFGLITQDRVRQIQQREGIDADGVVGTTTINTMLWPVVDYATGAYRGYCYSKWA